MSSHELLITPSFFSLQVVLLILGCFSICWLPYFIVACVQIFSEMEHSTPMLYKFAFTLAMANSGMNPGIYAWKNKNFRRSFALLLRCKNPDIAYREENRIPHKHNNNNSDTVSSRRGTTNKTLAVASGSDNDASTQSDRESHCSSVEPPTINGQTYSSNSHNNNGSLDQVHVSIIARLTQNQSILEADEEGVEEKRTGNATESMASSSTGTEITDDSFER